MSNDEIRPGQIWKRFTGEHCIPIKHIRRAYINGEHIADTWEALLMERQMLFIATFYKDSQKRKAVYERISEE